MKRIPRINSEKLKLESLVFKENFKKEISETFSGNGVLGILDPKTKDITSDLH